VAQHERTPVCPLKTSNAPLAIFVLPIDLLSFVLVEGVLTEFLKNPVAPVVAPPGLSKHEPAIDRSSRDEDSPQMPCLSPGRRRTQVRQLIIIAASNRARTLSKNKAGAAYDRPMVTLSNGSTLNLDKLRSRARNVGWGVQEELNSLWYAAALDEHQGE
jgi:hypothetical protein